MLVRACPCRVVVRILEGSGCERGIREERYEPIRELQPRI